MNRVSAQSEDLRKMQQEAMRRVQEMQSKTQSYVRGNNDRYGSFSLPKQNEQELHGEEINEYEKTRERNQNIKQTQRVRASARQVQQPVAPAPTVQPVTYEAENQNISPESRQECEPCEEKKREETVNSLIDTDAENEKTDEKRSFADNDIIIVLLILLLLNGNKSNSALILALVSLFI